MTENQFEKIAGVFVSAIFLFMIVVIVVSSIPLLIRAWGWLF